MDFLIHLFEIFTRFFHNILFFNCNIFSSDPEVPFLVLWLICACVYFTVKFNFVNFTRFGYSMSVIFGKYKEKDINILPDEEPVGKPRKRHPKQITSVEAMLTALSGSVGLGAVAGVAAAISIGGPGSILWMMVAAFLSMSIRFAEVFLGHYYRKQSKDHSEFIGGPFIYIARALEEHYNAKRLGKLVAKLFALMFVISSFGGPGSFQSNQAAKLMVQSLNMPNSQGMIAFVLTLFVAVVIIGGVTRIAHVAGKMTPFMMITYVASAVVIMACNWRNIDDAIIIIFKEGFNIHALHGGIVGSIIIGFQRALFSNEAGMGSGPIIHSNTSNKESVREGFVSMAAPFFDVFAGCLITALIILCTGVYQNTTSDGIGIVYESFALVHPHFPKVLTLVIVIFAFTTITAWSYYGLAAWQFMFNNYSKVSKFSYQIIFCVFIFVGGTIESFGVILDFADTFNLGTTIPNIFVLYLLSGFIKKKLNEYKEKYQ